MIGAYVEGRPMPSSSRVFTIVASVYLGGPEVKCCSGTKRRKSSLSPSVSVGSFFPPSRDLRRFSTRKNPGTTVTVVVALNVASPACISTEIVFDTDGVICDETKRSQMMLYKRYCSFVNESLRESGVFETYVGRIASCASCAPFPTE